MTESVQQQRITARKNQILDAAVIVFAEKGFHPTTIRDIAQQAGIADGTIYNYFDNKTALLRGIFERMRTAVLAEETPTVLPDADLHTLIKSFFSHSLTALEKDDFALFRIVLSEMMVSAELRQLYYEKVLEPTLAPAETAFQEQAAAQGIRLNEEDSRLTVRAIAGLVMGLMLSYSMGDELVRERWQEMPEFLTDVFINGLVSANGSRE